MAAWDPALLGARLVLPLLDKSGFYYARHPLRERLAGLLCIVLTLSAAAVLAVTVSDPHHAVRPLLAPLTLLAAPAWLLRSTLYIRSVGAVPALHRAGLLVTRRRAGALLPAWLVLPVRQCAQICTGVLVLTGSLLLTEDAVLAWILLGELVGLDLLVLCLTGGRSSGWDLLFGLQVQRCVRPQ